MSFLGSKANEGVWKRIGREVPPCEVLVSPFAGQCALTRMLQPAPGQRIVMDLDPDTVNWWHQHEPDVIAIQKDAVLWIEELALNVLKRMLRLLPEASNVADYYAQIGISMKEVCGLCSDGYVATSHEGKAFRALPFTQATTADVRSWFGISQPAAAVAPGSMSPIGRMGPISPMTPAVAADSGGAAAQPFSAGLPTDLDWRHWATRVVFCVDPPYVLSTRTHKRSVYRCELDDIGHIRLIRALRWLPCCVLLSGYPSTLYDALLTGWRRVDYTGASRGGPRPESLWCNLPTPEVPHDLRLVGTDYQKRWNLTKRDRRLKAKVAKMPLDERLRLFEALRSTLPPDLAAGAALPGSTATTGEARGA